MESIYLALWPKPIELRNRKTFTLYTPRVCCMTAMHSTHLSLSLSLSIGLFSSSSSRMSYHNWHSNSLSATKKKKSHQTLRFAVACARPPVLEKIDDKSVTVIRTNHDPSTLIFRIQNSMRSSACALARILASHILLFVIPQKTNSTK